MRRLVGVCVVLMAVGAGAQDAAPAAVAGGTVTGRLTFAETQLPARFAEVVLLRKPDAADLLQYSPERTRKPQSKVQKVVSMSGRSGLDGSYTIAEVPPGDYFAIAKLPGYVVPVETPANEKEARDIGKLTAQLAVVHVDVNRVSTADLVLHRGGAIAGRMRFQDGSPAVGALVTVEPAAAESPWELGVGYPPLAMALQSRGNLIDGGSSRGLSGLTDDEGRYRIAGLPPGKYRVNAVVHTGGGYRMVSERGGISGRPVNGVGDSVMTVYVPGAMRRADATVFEIRGDERVADADLELSLSGLHTVRGRVLAKEDRRVPNNVSITLSIDGDKGQQRFTSVELDGSFHFDYLPQGTYTLQVKAVDVDQKEPSPGSQPDEIQANAVHPYASVKVPVIVAEHDVTVDDLLLAPSTAEDGEQDDPQENPSDPRMR
jgi:hypothetical protein